MAQQHRYYFSTSGAGITGDVANHTIVWINADGSSAGAVPTLSEIGLGWYGFDHDPTEDILWEVTTSTALVGHSGIAIGELTPREEAPPTYTPWYQPRFQYQDTPGLATSSRPIATIRRISDGEYYTGSAWQIGSATVEMVEQTVTTTGLYEYTIPYADVSDDEGRYTGVDGYRIKIVGDQGIKHLIVYPMDAGYDVYSSQFRGADIPIVPMTGGGIVVLHQRVQWSTASTGASPSVSFLRLSDGKVWDDTTSTWGAIGASGTLTGVTGANGYYQYTIPENKLERVEGREGYLVIIKDGPSGVELQYVARYMPVASHDDLRVNHNETGSFGEVVQNNAADYVWQATATDYSGAGTMGLLARLSVGLAFNNYRLSSPTYDANGNMLTGTIKVYPTAADAVANTSPLQSFSITCTYSGNQLSTYLVEGTT